MKGEHPPVKRNLGALEHRSNGDGELFLAGIAVVQAGTVFLATDEGGSFGGATVRAEPAIGPTDRLQVLTGLVFVLKDGIREVGHVKNTLSNCVYCMIWSHICQVYNYG